jgi:undecaprenyl-diphosphatase
MAVKSKNSQITAALLAAAVYVLLWMGFVVPWAWLDSADSWTLRQFHDFGVVRPGWVDFWRAISNILSPTSLRILALVGAVVALVRHRARVAVFLLTTVMGMGLVTEIGKTLSDRPRPDTALTQAASTAFPSGHALGMTVGVLAFLTVLWPSLTLVGRRGAVGVGVGLILTVSLARVILNVHHPSDVVAGWALGLLYYLLYLRLVSAWRPRRRG